MAELHRAHCVANAGYVACRAEVEIDSRRGSRRIRRRTPARRAPIAHLPNVSATPHIGYVTEDLYRTFYSDAAASIAAWLDGRGTM
jgi:hypothetical protein